MQNELEVRCNSQFIAKSYNLYSWRI